MSDAPSVYTKNGIIYVRASAFGACDLKLWAIYDGVQPMEHSDMTKRAFKEGHLHEEAMRQELTADGYEMSGDQEEIELKILPNRLHIIGHIDGFVNLGDSSEFDIKTYGEESRLWEAKAMSRNAFDDWVKDTFDYRPGYAWQLAIYMLGSGRDKAHYTVKRRDDGLIQNWLIDELPKSKSEIRSRALHLYKMFRSGEMPACNANGGEKWFCEFWFLHGEDEVPVPDPEIPADNIPELEETLAAYYEVIETAKWCDGEKKRLRKKIQDEFRNGRDAFGSDSYKVVISHNERKNFDKTKLAVDMGQEFIDKYTKKTRYERWDLNPRKG